MKKIFSIILTICIFLGALLTLAGCGNREEQYIGRWTIDSVETDGVAFTVEEFNEMRKSNMLNDFYVEIRTGGKAYVHTVGGGQYMKWELTDGGIKIGEQEFSVKNKMLSATYNGATLFLKKESA